MGELLISLGNYYLKEKNKLLNRTNICKILFSDLYDMKPVAKIDELLKIRDYVDKQMLKIENLTGVR